MDETPHEAVTLTVRLTLHDESDCIDALMALWAEVRRVQAHMATVRANPKIPAATLRAGLAGVTEYPLRRADGRRCIVARHAEVDTYHDGLKWLDNMSATLTR